MKKRFVNIEKQINALQIKLNNDDAKIKNKRICKMHKKITFITTQISKSNDDFVNINYHYKFFTNMKKFYVLKQHAKKVFFYEN